jgi:hypothetical protein
MRTRATTGAASHRSCALPCKPATPSALCDTGFTGAIRTGFGRQPAKPAR